MYVLEEEVPIGAVAPARISDRGGRGQVRLVKGVLRVVDLVVGSIGVERSFLVSGELRCSGAAFELEVAQWSG